MKILFTSLLLVFFFITQAQESLDKKYLIALIHLRSNESLNLELKDFFYNYTPKKTNLLEFKTTSQVEPLSIWSIDRLSNHNFNSNINELLNEYNQYYKQHQFKPFKNKQLKKLVPIKKSKLKLTFSKPLGNYLLVEVCPIKNSTQKAAQILFIFNPDGLVKSVLTFYKINK